MMPVGTPVGRMRRAVEQLLKETAELREHLQQGTDLHEAARLQRQSRSRGNARPTAVPESTAPNVLGARALDQAEASAHNCGRVKAVRCRPLKPC